MPRRPSLKRHLPTVASPPQGPRTQPDPLPGDIWYSARIGHRVRVYAVSENRIVYVTDGRQKYPMFLSHFQDPLNDWILENRRK